MTFLTLSTSPRPLDSPDPRDWLPPADELVRACEGACAGPEPEGLVALLEGLGAPVLDMVVTPLTARACVLGAMSGRAFYHHELRGRLPMPGGLEPEVAVWEEGTVPTWNAGVLEEPKYFSFFQDGPFPAFNPNHRRKWRAHELLHGAVRYYWHPQMTRFEFYVSARINELLPVVHWYGLDEVLRPRCARHRGRLLERAYCRACEEAATAYWEPNAARFDDFEGNVAHVEHAWEHLAEEWGAVLREIETGRVVATPRRYLDASSDAVGYMRAHWNRVTAWSFGQWTEMFLVDGLDYFSSLDALAANSEAVTRRLVGGELRLTAGEFEARRARRLLQDVAYRALLALEWLEEGSRGAEAAEDALMPELEEAAGLCNALIDDTSATAAVPEMFARIDDAFTSQLRVFPPEVAAPFAAHGHLWFEAERHVDAAAPLIAEGFETAFGDTADRFDDERETVLRAFAHSPEFNDLGRLTSRFARFVARTRPDHPAAARVAFDAWSADDPRRDEEAELFGALPDDLSELVRRPGRLRANETLRRRTYAPALVAELTGEAYDGDVTLAAVYMRGELRVIVEDEASRFVFEKVVEDGGRDVASWVGRADRAALENLLDNGFVVWLPAPARVRSSAKQTTSP